jgi:hypothetical protein
MKASSRDPSTHRTLVVIAGIIGLAIALQAIVKGPAPARAAPGQAPQAVINAPFDQPPFSNFGQGAGSFSGGPDLRTTVS